MQKTTNYKLPKWEKADRILMDDFNGLTETLDTALHGVAVSAEAAQAAADSEAADRQAAVAAEATARENAVTAEATARENADAALRTAVDGKQAKLTGAATTIAASNLTASRALVSNASGKVAVSAVTATELGYLDGVTSAVQTQLNGKAASSHTHAQSAITGLTAALAAVPKIAVGTYTGTGTYGVSNKNTLTFSFPPKIIFILLEALTGNAIGATFLSGMTKYADNSTNSATTGAKLALSWSGNSVTWYCTENSADRQFNGKDCVYHYLAIG